MRDVAVAVAAMAVFTVAQAQDKPAAAPPPSWHQGKPPALGESTLHPFAPNLTGRAAKDLPTDKLKVPAGFKVEVWAEGIPEARWHARGEDHSQGPQRAERHRLQPGNPVCRGARQDHALRRHRRQARQSGRRQGGGRGPRSEPAAGALLEVPRLLA